MAISNYASSELLAIVLCVLRTLCTTTCVSCVLVLLPLWHFAALWFPGPSSRLQITFSPAHLKRQPGVELQIILP